MANLFIEFKKLIGGEKPEADLLVPLLIWASGSEKNIEKCQDINRKFFHGNRKVFISEVTLHNKCKHIIRYPKVDKDDEKTKFFYDDICEYFSWSHKELQKNLSSIDIDSIKNTIAKAFCYDNKQRRSINLEVIDYGRKNKRIGTANNKRVTETELESDRSEESFAKFKGS